MSEVVIEVGDTNIGQRLLTFEGDNHSDFSDTPINRTEEPWTDRTEDLLRRWARQMEALSELHDSAGYLIKNRYYRLAIPNVIIPFSMTFISQIIPEEDASYVNGVLFLITSALSGFQALFGYGELYEKHFAYSSNYSNIVSRIESELSRQRKFRIPADVFITEIKCNINNLNDNAPTLPLGFC